ncbi:ABC-F family ATP-binding cassette domain-containing protein [Microbacterium sp. NPDC028030]|uniref:ABC-F family ATP-binding cassette domain-containing protein n=1 Tax=Microbacterium sp. NPDC028030 TaxID=3155124 RepID=UPI0033D36440
MRSRAHRSCELRSASVRFADRIVLDRVDLVVGPVDRLAIIGDNGVGKSTLLDLLAGVITPDAGEAVIEVPGGIAHAAQDPTFPPGATIDAAIDLLLGDLRILEHDLQRAYALVTATTGQDQERAMAEVTVLQDRFEARGGYDVDHRIDAALDQLGVGGLRRGRPVSTLSGGERARLALAVALSADAELLLLDEPTNDLDDQALSWMAERLDGHRGALIVVTHDRDFLERFAIDIVQVQDGALRRYGDGYAGFLRARLAERRRLAERHEEWKADLARNEALIAANAFRMDAIPRKLELDGFGHGAFRARSREHGAAGRIRMAKERVARLRAHPCPPPPEPLRFRMAAGEQTVSDSALIRVDGLRLDHGDRRLRLEDWTLRPGERWLVTGPNGAGKTTLLALVSGELAPDAGMVDRGAGVRMAWLRQDVRGRGTATAVESFATRSGVPLADALGVLIGQGLLREEDAARSVGSLSVGQRRRLDLAVALASPADVILLDEPTNHLDPELVDQLESALIGHPGAIVTVTHDRRWRRHAERQGVRHVRVPEGGAVVLRG